MNEQFVSLDIDPFDPEVMKDPIPLDTEIRNAGPMVWLPKYEVWVTGQYDVAREIFMDWERFSSSFGTGFTNVKRDTPWRKPSVILEVDPPVHTAARKVLMRALSPVALKKLKEHFKVVADEMVDAAVEKGSFDVAKDLAFAFPFKVLPDAVGLKPEAREHLIPYANLNFNAMGPKNELYQEALKRVEEDGSFDFVEWQCARENILPGGFGEAIYSAADAGDIAHEDASMLVRTFLSAGIDTTILGIGMTFVNLARNLDQWKLLESDPTLARAAFEETLRYTPPSHVIGRTTSKGFNFHGADLEKEQKVFMFLSAANRDSDHWDDPEKYDIKRRTSGHLGFGAGIHGCVGQALARLEAETVIESFARKVKSFELTAEPERGFNNWLRGYKSIPIKVVAR